MLDIADGVKSELFTKYVQGEKLKLTPTLMRSSRTTGYTDALEDVFRWLLNLEAQQDAAIEAAIEHAEAIAPV
jgi:hypothetical protein